MGNNQPCREQLHPLFTQVHSHQWLMHALRFYRNVHCEFPHYCIVHTLFLRIVMCDRVLIYCYNRQFSVSRVGGILPPQKEWSGNPVLVTLPRLMLSGNKHSVHVPSTMSDWGIYRLMYCDNSVVLCQLRPELHRYTESHLPLLTVYEHEAWIVSRF